jgi:SAM-dependent methyltransferase
MALVSIAVLVGRGRPGMATGTGLRRALVFSLAVPRGPLGWIVALVIPLAHRPMYPLVAGVLSLQPDDDLLEVACGSGVFLKEHASEVRSIAGLDASDIQVRLARRRLARRVDAATAEIVIGDAAALPWEDGRFDAVACMGSLEFFPEPQQALNEMHRVLRPGGRAVVTMGSRSDHPKESGTTDAWGTWVWSEADARRMMEDAGFAGVLISYGRWADGQVRLVRGVM